MNKSTCKKRTVGGNRHQCEGVRDLKMRYNNTQLATRKQSGSIYELIIAI